MSVMLGTLALRAASGSVRTPALVVRARGSTPRAPLASGSATGRPPHEADTATPSELRTGGFLWLARSDTSRTWRASDLNAR